MLYTDAQKAKAALWTLFVVTILNAAFIAGVIRTFKPPPARTYSYIGHDFPAQLPLDLPATGIPLVPGGPRFSIYADDDWGTLFPPSDGFTDLPLAGSSDSAEANQTFLVAMVHQLHCLDILRVGFATNRTGYAEHVEHCLRYLLQTVLCTADATLEAADVGAKDGVLLHKAAGVGAVHRCRDWTVLREYMEEHPAAPAKAENIAMH